MKKGKNDSSDHLRPDYDLDTLEIVAWGPGWAKPGWAKRRLLRRKGQARAVNPKRLVVISNPAHSRATQRKG
ncbi:MAG: hypothetical protein M3410_03770 [Acidobacteriota bacterium]|nr:hypothetical protein [Acidobacteriota bacterium]